MGFGGQVQYAVGLMFRKKRLEVLRVPDPRRKMRETVAYNVSCAARNSTKTKATTAKTAVYRYQSTRESAATAIVTDTPNKIAAVVKPNTSGMIGFLLRRNNICSIAVMCVSPVIV